MASIKNFSSNLLRNDKKTFKVGVTHWKASTTALRKGLALQDCIQDGFHQFIKSIKVRADSYGRSKSGALKRLNSDLQKPGEKRLARRL